MEAENYLDESQLKLWKRLRSNPAENYYLFLPNVMQFRIVPHFHSTKLIQYATYFLNILKNMLSSVDVVALQEDNQSLFLLRWLLWVRVDKASDGGHSYEVVYGWVLPHQGWWVACRVEPLKKYQTKVTF